MLRESIKTPEDEQKYKDVTYKQLQDFLNYYSNEIYCNQIKEDATRLHEATVHEPIKAKVEEVKSKWEKFIEDHDVNRYLHIEVITGYYSDYWYSHPDWYFKVKQPKVALSDCNVSYNCYNRNTGDECWSTNEAYTDLEGLLACNSKNNGRYYTQITNSDFWNTYEMKTTIHSVTLKDGTVISENDCDEVPSSVKSYLEDKNEVTELALILDQIDPAYTSADKFVYDAIQKDLRSKDSLCYELVNRVNQSSYGNIRRGFEEPQSTEAVTGASIVVE